ncbi:MAG: hypothetical protein FJ134_04040 [Deltaproteobacteria bacterium]|nr:hypothetical protein [Deltaproteobacteria bacterium]
MNKLHLYLLALGLTAVGLALFVYKALVLNFPLVPGEVSEIWKVETKITFAALNEPIKVSVYLPRYTAPYVVTDEAFVSRGYGISTTTDEVNRQAVWTIRKARGQQTLYYQAEVRRVDQKEPLTAPQPPKIEKPRWEGADLAAAESLVAEIRRKSADTESLVANLFRLLNLPQADHNVQALLARQASESAKVDLATQLLALADIPAWVVHGVHLKEDKEAALVHWLEVFDGKQWRAFNPATGGPGVPKDFLPWWRGPYPLVQLKGGERLHVVLSATRNLEEAIESAVVRGRLTKPFLQKFSLLSLPVLSQKVYRVLLMVPVGAFLLVILRNVIGLSTFGTFMPVLIALAFRETHLLGGVILFSLMVGLGLIVRFYLDYLKLLLVPRLAAVLIVVVILMVLVSMVTHKLGWETGLSVALFPMVIMTMTIERMTIVWEERGPAEALKQGVGSLLAAALIYLVIHNRHVQHLVFLFPELLLVLLAGTVLLGRYCGYRLLEMPRFRALVKGKS